ncbi:MAG: response regulator transcription factor [Pseudomonadota bacterium]
MQPLEKLSILLVEDHHDLAETVVDFLESMGAVVDYAADGMTGLHLARQHRFDVIVLDLMLPGMDGYTLCHEIREKDKNSTPIIMMTARDELGDKLQGFECGADDYVVKPFDLPELVARIKSLSRRHQGNVTSEVLCVADLELDTGTHEVRRAGDLLQLTPAGFQILRILLKKMPNVVSREEIEAELWGDDPPASDTLRSQIYKLRKMVDKPYALTLLHTVAGSGYRISESDSDA